MIRLPILSTLLLLAVGYGNEADSQQVDAANARDEQQAAVRRPPTETEKEESIPAAAEKLIWRWLDANIAAQQRLAAARTGQRLSGADVGEEIELASAGQLLFKEQLNLLRAIKKSKNIVVARQYMLVHTLMTIDQAQHTQSRLPANDPRRAGVLRQINTANELLTAIGYDRNLE